MIFPAWLASFLLSDGFGTADVCFFFQSLPDRRPMLRVNSRFPSFDVPFEDVSFS